MDWEVRGRWAGWTGRCGVGGLGGLGGLALIQAVSRQAGRQ